MRAIPLVFTLVPTAAQADPATEARVFYARGARHASAGRPAEALDAFLQSQAAARNPNTLLAIAQTYEILGYREPAFATYAELEALTNQGPLKKQAAAALRRLSRRVAPVALESDPPGADVFLERESLGRFCRTPCRIALAPGRHRFKVKRHGWREAEVEVQARVGREVSVHVPLDRVTGTLRVESQPAAQTVRVRGTAEASATTPANLQLPPGRYDVEVSGEHHLTTHQEAMVWENRTTRIFAPLVPRPPPQAHLLLSAGPQPARVTIDDKPAGFAPLMLDVDPGFRRIRVEQSGFEPWEGRVRFAPGERVRVFSALAATGASRRRHRTPLVALALGAVAAGAGSWMIGKEDLPVAGSATLAVGGAAITLCIGLLLDRDPVPAGGTRVERDEATDAAP